MQSHSPTSLVSYMNLLSSKLNMAAVPEAYLKPDLSVDGQPLSVGTTKYEGYSAPKRKFSPNSASSSLLNVDTQTTLAFSSKLCCIKQNVVQWISWTPTSGCFQKRK